MSLACIFAPQSWAEEFEFDPNFLHRFGSDKNIDLSGFSSKNHFIAGTYNVDVSLNGHNLNYSTDVNFKTVANQPTPKLCLNQDLIHALPLNTSKLNKQSQAALSAIDSQKSTCTHIDTVLPRATYAFDKNQLALNLIIPHEYLTPNYARSTILYSKPATTAFIKYQASASHAKQTQINNTQTRLSSHLTLGANIGNVYMRHAGYLHKDNNGSRYSKGSTFVGTDILGINSQLVMGQIHTRAYYSHESVSLLGLNLYSDDQMRPEQNLGFAPIIKGHAHSTADVTITQNNREIYKTTVAAGDFEITDLPATYQSDLKVTVKESDGTSHSFWVNNQYSGTLLRPQNYRYSIGIGALDSSVGASHSPMVATGNVEYGLNNYVSLMTGLNISRDYQSYSAGLKFRSQLGASGIEGQSSYTQNSTYNAQRLHLWHNVSLSPLASLSANATLYSKIYYKSLNQYYASNRLNQPLDESQNSQTRKRLGLHYNQSLPKNYGHVSLSAMYSDQQNELRLNYNNHWKTLNYGFSTTLHRSNESSPASQWSVYAQMPFRPHKSLATLSTTLTHSNDTLYNTTQIYGTAYEKSETPVHYSLGSSSGNGNASLNASASARTSVAALSASARKTSDESYLGASASGAIVAHSGGVNFSNQLSDTYAIVEAKNATGAQIGFDKKTKIGSNGYGVLPSVSPYRNNYISLNPQGLPTGLEITPQSKRLSPRANVGHITRFTTTLKQAVLFTIKTPKGDFAPFGTAVLNQDGENLGIITDFGRFFTTLPMGKNTVFHLKIGDKHCRFSYIVNKQTHDMATQTTQCHYE